MFFIKCDIKIFNYSINLKLLNLCDYFFLINLYFLMININFQIFFNFIYFTICSVRRIIHISFKFLHYDFCLIIINKFINHLLLILLIFLDIFKFFLIIFLFF